MKVSAIGRTNDIPNLASGKFFIGGTTGQISPYTLPIADGSPSQILQTNGSGTVSFADLEALPSGGTTGQALVKIDGTDYNVQWADIAVDVQYHDRYQSQSATLRSGATATTEIYYSAIADGDGYAESASSDTPTSGYDIQRKLYYAEEGFADPDTGTWTQFTAIADNTSFATAKATLLEYLKARTGGTVPISLKMTWEEVVQAPSFTGLLNESYGSGAAAAYGTRRLNGNYSGNCMTIRRADGVTLGVGFVGEDIDESAITTFCSGSTCTVQVWHDQSGNGNDASQTDSTKQPTIYTGGALVKDGGRLALDFDGTDDELTSTTVPFSGTTHRTSFTVSNADTATSADIIYGIDGGTASAPAGELWQLTSESAVRVSGKIEFVSSAQTSQSLATVIFDGTTVDDINLYLNGSLKTQTGSTGTTINTGSTNFGIGTTPVTTNNYDGKQQELIFYASDKSTDRTSIEGNISGYYQSAKLLNEAYGSGAAAAYSVRLLDRDYTGSAVQLERTSDNSFQDIGFDVNGDLDESAITTFCTGTTCKVRTWYDQSGNANNAVQTDHTKQPTIYTGGAIVKLNGRVAVEFEGTDDRFQLDVSASGLNLDVANTSSFHVAQYDNATSDRSMSLSLGGSSGAGRWYPMYMDNGNFEYGYGAVTQVSTEIGNTNQNLSTMIAGSTLGQAQAWRNGVSTMTATLATSGIMDDVVGIGVFRTSWYLDGTVQEVVIYDSDKSTDRTSIESNIGDYFTQNTPLLDTYTGAAAAYSLRKLRSAYSGSAIRVRRASDNAEQDIGFNVFGELDTVSLASFCSGTDGFVKTWYDQSGNANDATQTNTANQPKIYDSSTGVTTDGTKPTIEFASAGNSNLVFTRISDIQTIFTVRSSSGVQLRTNFMGDSANNDYRSASGVLLSGSAASYVTGGSNYIDGALTNYTATAKPTTQSLFTMIHSSANGRSNYLTQDRSNTARSWDGPFSELIIYNTDKSTNRTNIEDNINTFYSIY
jgi:hypothetical protein